jgi:hypothetical protein
MGLELEEKQLRAIHQESIETDVQNIARRLIEWLTAPLAAVIAGVESDRTISRWADGSVTRIGLDKEERLRSAYLIAQLLLQYDAPRVVRSWFVGLNPVLETSPAKAIRAGRHAEALKAAREFVIDG